METRLVKSLSNPIREIKVSATPPIYSLQQFSNGIIIMLEINGLLLGSSVPRESKGDMRHCFGLNF
jgi:hypothetical protein